MSLSLFVFSLSLSTTLNKHSIVARGLLQTKKNTRNNSKVGNINNNNKEKKEEFSLFKIKKIKNNSINLIPFQQDSTSYKCSVCFLLWLHNRVNKDHYLVTSVTLQQSICLAVCLKIIRGIKIEQQKK